MIFSSYFGALILTILIEVSVGYACKFKLTKEIVLVNLVTHPILHLILIYGISSVIVLEILATLIEFILLRITSRYDWRKLLILSITMNFISYSLGWFLILR
jgi:hypothetical protein